MGLITNALSQTERRQQRTKSLAWTFERLVEVFWDFLEGVGECMLRSSKAFCPYPLSPGLGLLGASPEREALSRLQWSPGLSPLHPSGAPDGLGEIRSERPRTTFLGRAWRDQGSREKDAQGPPHSSMTKQMSPRLRHCFKC